MFGRKKLASDEIFDLLQEGVIRVDGYLKIAHANRAACEFLEMTPKALQHKDLRQLSHPILSRGFELLVQAQKDSKRVCGSLSHEREAQCELVASFPAPKTGVLLIRDLSNQQQLVEMGKAFVANASHELRTPITII